MYDPTLSRIADSMHADRLAQAAQRQALTDAGLLPARRPIAAQCAARLHDAGAALWRYRAAPAVALQALARRIAPHASGGSR